MSYSILLLVVGSHEQGWKSGRIYEAVNSALCLAGNVTHFGFPAAVGPRARAIRLLNNCCKLGCVLSSQCDRTLFVCFFSDAGPRTCAPRHSVHDDNEGANRDRNPEEASRVDHTPREGEYCCALEILHL